MRNNGYPSLRMSLEGVPSLIYTSRMGPHLDRIYPLEMFCGVD